MLSEKEVNILIYNCTKNEMFSKKKIYIFS